MLSGLNLFGGGGGSDGDSQEGSSNSPWLNDMISEEEEDEEEDQANVRYQDVPRQTDSPASSVTDTNDETTARPDWASMPAGASSSESDPGHVHRLIPTSSSLDDLRHISASEAAFDTNFYDGLERIEPIDFNPFESKRVKSLFSMLEGEKTLSKRFKGMVEAERKKLKVSFDQRKAKWQHQLAQRRTRIEKRVLEEVKKPTFIRKKDKIAFSFGIVNVITTAFLVGRFPELIPYYYLFWTFFLLAFRFVTYHMDGYHYFMLDFCYYSNLLLCFYLVFYPSSPFLFVMSFVNSNGPLLWAILAWRNSLVFHDLDKITSIFIHVFPPIVTFMLRWEPSLQEKYAVCTRPDCSIGLSEIFIPHIVFFLYWQLTYFLKTEVIDYHHLQKNPSLQTSFRWMLKTPKSAHFRLTNYFGPKYQILMFMGVQFIYHIVCIIPIILMWNFFWLHAIIGAYVCWCSIWNGANFYIEKFSRDYFSKLEEISHALELEAASPPPMAHPLSPEVVSPTTHTTSTSSLSD